MKQIENLFTAIAREHLSIATLDERHRDSLNFHVVRAAAVQHALQAAYDAGSADRIAAAPLKPAVFQRVMEALERAEFLMRRVHEGDHHALPNLSSGARQARSALRAAKAAASVSTAAECVPILAIMVEGGLIDDMNSTSPLHVVVEDWDVPDEDTGRKPTRTVWKLAGGLSGPKAEKLRRLIAND
ncbi:MAG: DUF6900 domain-containing protein [Isosphaeraceae bacterium]